MISSLAGYVDTTETVGIPKILRDYSNRFSTRATRGRRLLCCCMSVVKGKCEVPVITQEL